MKHTLFILAVLIGLASCTKPTLPDNRLPAFDSGSYSWGASYFDSTYIRPGVPTSRRILVDASRGGTATSNLPYIAGSYLPDGSHNLALYSAGDFGNLDEPGFWREYEFMAKKFGNVDFGHYRDAYERRLTELTNAKK